MTYINCGARDDKGNRFPSKAAMRRAIADNPKRVVLATTSELGPQRIATVYELQQERNPDVWTVVGPDPHTDRRWYGSLTVDRRDGQVKVK